MVNTERSRTHLVFLAPPSLDARAAWIATATANTTTTTLSSASWRAAKAACHGQAQACKGEDKVMWFSSPACTGSAAVRGQH